MPLNAAKIAHIKANIVKMNAGRQQQVILTLRTAGGGTSTLTVNAVWRVMGDFDPTYEGPNNVRFQGTVDADVEAIFNQADVTLPQLRACIWASLGSDATGAQPATKYTLMDIEPVGIMPGGDRFFTRWTRQH